MVVRSISCLFDWLAFCFPGGAAEKTFVRGSGRRCRPNLLLTFPWPGEPPPFPTTKYPSTQPAHPGEYFEWFRFFSSHVIKVAHTQCKQVFKFQWIILQIPICSFYESCTEYLASFTGPSVPPFRDFLIGFIFIKLYSDQQPQSLIERP